MTVGKILYFVFIAVESAMVAWLCFFLFTQGLESFKTWKAKRKTAQLEAIDAALKARGEELKRAYETIDTLRSLDESSYRRNNHLKVRNDELEAKNQALIEQNSALKTELKDRIESLDLSRRVSTLYSDENSQLKISNESLAQANEELVSRVKAAEERVETLDSLYINDYRYGKKLEEKIKELNQKLEQNIVAETEKPQNNNTINSEDVKVSKRSKKG